MDIKGTPKWLFDGRRKAAWERRLALQTLIRPLARGVFLLWSFLLLLAQHSFGADRAISDLSGDVKAIYYSRDGRVSYSYATRFEMFSDDSRFRIRLEKPGQNIQTDYNEIAWDGTNCYYIEALPSWVRQQREKGALVASNVATATITGIPVPQFGPPVELGGILWCAYASASYLKQHSQSNLIYVPFTTEMLNGEPATPDSFVRRPAFWLLSSDDKFPLNLAYVSATSGSPAFTNAIYECTGWTNFEGNKIPTSGVAALFSANESGSQKIAEFAFTLQTAQQMSADFHSFQPVVPGLTVVTEERLNSATANIQFSYTIDSNWPTVDQVKLTQPFWTANRAGAFTADRSNVRQLPNYAKIGILLLFAVSAVFILVRHYVRRESSDPCESAK